MVTAFNTVKFIKEIEKRPVIYDNSCDKVRKLQAWVEIGRSMLPHWDYMSLEDKLNEEKFLRNKWRNIRDYFIKDMKLSDGDRKRRRYSYFEQLRFLIPFCKINLNNFSFHMNEGVNNSQPPITIECKVEMSDGENDVEIVEEYDMNPSTSNDSNNQQMVSINPGYAKLLDPLSGEVSFDNDIQNMSSHVSQNDIHYEEDFDKMFLLSLLPSFRQVPENMKLKVRIDIQQILASALNFK